MNATCATTWPLENPNAEDAALRRHHHCGQPAGHEAPHRCVCGDHATDFEVALLAALYPTDKEKA